MEVPFSGENSERDDNHIDFFVTKNDIGIFGEVKRLHGLGKWREVCGYENQKGKFHDGDADRLLDKVRLKKIIKRGETKPEKVYALILAEAWENAKWEIERKYFGWRAHGNNRGKRWKRKEKWNDIYNESKLKTFDQFGYEKITSIEYVEGNETETWDLVCLYTYKFLDIKY